MDQKLRFAHSQDLISIFGWLRCLVNERFMVWLAGGALRSDTIEGYLSAETSLEKTTTQDNRKMCINTLDVRF